MFFHRVQWQLRTGLDVQIVIRFLMSQSSWGLCLPEGQAQTNRRRHRIAQHMICGVPLCLKSKARLDMSMQEKSPWINKQKMLHTHIRCSCVIFYIIVIYKIICMTIYVSVCAYIHTHKCIYTYMSICTDTCV